MAVDFKNYNVAAVSIWLGPLKTERTARAAQERPDQYAHFMEIGESPEFSGQVIYAMYNDPNIMEISGQTWIGAEEGRVVVTEVEAGAAAPVRRVRDLLRTCTAQH